MKTVLSHPTGNQFVRALLTALAEAQLLAEFNTTLAVDPGAKWLNVLPRAIRQECLRRTFPVAGKQVRTYPVREVARMVLPRIGLARYVQHELGWACLDSVYRAVDKAAARRLPRLVRTGAVGAVYAYEDGAFATFEQAKRLGLKCVYDLPIAHWETGRKLMQQEAERLPAWAVTLGGGIRDSAAKLERKDNELNLADVVVVPGQFVRDSLPAWAAGKRVVVAPFGSPEAVEVNHGKEEMKKPKADRPLRVLFAGSMGQRKGLGDLFAAMRLLNRPDVELVVMGAPLASFDLYRRELPHFTYVPGRPHEQVLALMRSCDVFCLPSIVEGRALVMQEAMSQGLPLLITPNTGGADLIREGDTGFLIPIRSPEAIAEKLTWFLDNRSELPRMNGLARQHAAQYTWTNYTARIIESITDPVG